LLASEVQDVHCSSLRSGRRDVIYSPSSNPSQSMLRCSTEAVVLSPHSAHLRSENGPSTACCLSTRFHRQEIPVATKMLAKDEFGSVLPVMETCLILSGKFPRDPVAYGCRLELAEEDCWQRHIDASGDELRERKPREISRSMARSPVAFESDQNLGRSEDVFIMLRKGQDRMIVSVVHGLDLYSNSSCRSSS
jgi:hypothetical protein